MKGPGVPRRLRDVRRIIELALIEGETRIANQKLVEDEGGP